MIKEIYLFTNRNTIFFDESGNQMPEHQAKISWKNDHSNSRLETLLSQIIEDNPKIYLAKWLEWKQEISIDEFFSLIGKGPWYWNIKNGKSGDYVDF